MTMQNSTSWDIEDDDVKNDDGNTLVFDEVTGLYKKTREYMKEGKLVREILEYKLETFEVSETVKARKSLKKFGAAKFDPPGPNPANTYFGDEVFMKFCTDDTVVVEEEKKIKEQLVKCRNCDGEHFSHKCPYKQEIQSIQELTARLEGVSADNTANNDDKMITDIVGGKNSGRYVPPHLRGDLLPTLADKRKAENVMTIRVSNLPEAVQEADLSDLFRPFGTVTRTYLAKDKVTNLSRGFAYITFTSRIDAAKAIEGVNKFGYDHCILQVEWAKQ